MQKTFTRWEKKAIEGFEEQIFSLNHDDEFKEQARHEEEIKKIIVKNDYKKFMGLIYSKERDINIKLLKKHFFVQDLGDLLKELKGSKNNPKKIKIWWMQFKVY